ncbi:5-(carboxyamino)imidazole ribonucleotide synthase [Halobacteriales archaeon QS_9_70_65]|nr:MAG: 5-(carboxyamino)imidazole ribonucleotide synthase [Halobacteriales archaeon QS_9_70_65]
MPHTTPAATIGVVGGGQLARMLGEAAGPLGVEVVVSDPTPDCPAAPVVRDQVVGDFDDRAADTPVHPDPDTLRTIQDKLVQNRALTDAGIPVPAFRGVDTAAELRAAGEELGWPLMLKAREGGYDGRGNFPVESPDDAEAAVAETGPAVVEELVDFERELAVIGVKGKDEVRAFPVTETVHEAEILRELVTPARTAPAVRERAREVALEVLETLDGRGVYGIELFELNDGEILVNEIAPRPHNSGHWTIEGAHSSQFEQHARAVLGWPLGSAERRAPSVTTNVLGDVEDPQPAELSGVEAVLEAPAASLHWYGKREVRPLRKMGHVTLSNADSDAETLLERARELRDGLTFT